ncbi:hypothetical protein EJB05_36685, partial [Eragrostis curvula]
MSDRDSDNSGPRRGSWETRRFVLPAFSNSQNSLLSITGLENNGKSSSSETIGRREHYGKKRYRMWQEDCGRAARQSRSGLRRRVEGNSPSGSLQVEWRRGVGKTCCRRQRGPVLSGGSSQAESFFIQIRSVYWRSSFDHRTELAAGNVTNIGLRQSFHAGHFGKVLTLSFRSDGSDKIDSFSEWPWELARIRACKLYQIWLQPEFGPPSPSSKPRRRRRRRLCHWRPYPPHPPPPSLISGDLRTSSLMLKSLLHTSLRYRPAPSRLFYSAATAAVSTSGALGGGGGGYGTISAVLEIVGPIELLFPASEARLYVRLVRRCSRDALAAGTAAAHAHVVKRGFVPDVFVSNVLLDSYTKGGSLAAGRQLFDETPHRDVVSWCTIIAAHASRSLFVEAIGLFKKLLSSDQVKPNRFVISSVLNACARSGVMELGLMVHGLVVKSGLGVDRFVEVGFVDMYAKCGNVGDAVRLFNEIPVKSSVAWNAMLSGFSENGCFMEAAELCQDMHRVGMALDVVTLRVVASVAATLGMFEFASNIHVYALKVGLETDCFVVSELIKSAGRTGDTQYIGKLVAAVKRRDASLYTLAISSYHSNGCQVEAFTFSTILSACAETGAKHAGEQIHGHLIKIGSEYLDVIVGNALIDLYVNCNDEALQLFSKMQHSGLRANRVTFARILRGCADLCAIDLGRQLHASIIKMGLISDVYVANALVGMYRRSWAWAESRRNSQETLPRNGQEQNSKESCSSEQMYASSTLEEIGLFTLDEKKDHDTVSDAWKIYTSAASQFYESPIPIHVVGHELDGINTLIGEGRSVKCNESSFGEQLDIEAISFMQGHPLNHFKDRRKYHLTDMHLIFGWCT